MILASREFRVLYVVQAEERSPSSTLCYLIDTCKYYRSYSLAERGKGVQCSLFREFANFQTLARKKDKNLRRDPSVRPSKLQAFKQVEIHSKFRRWNDKLKSHIFFKKNAKKMVLIPKRTRYYVNIC